MNEELKEYLNNHDLDEDEAELLINWVENGFSVYENPDGFCESDGTPMSFMRWYWISEDDSHPEHRRLLYHRRKSDNKDIQETSWFLGTEELRGEAAYNYLVHFISDMEKMCQRARILARNIEAILEEIDLTGNLVGDASNLDEAISFIGDYVSQFTDCLKLYTDHAKECKRQGCYHPIFSSRSYR